jgi:nucleotide-binding universal stress UspA family protein
MSILVAVGDDDRFETVLDVAVRLAAGLDQGLYVAHVTANESATGDERAFRDEVRAYLSAVDVPVDVNLEYLDRSGLRSGTAIGNQLLDLAEDVAIDHIVVGHHSKDRLTTVREGHAGFVVAEAAAVPVTIVPEAVESTARD